MVIFFFFLLDILAGSCGLFNNYNLCHMKTINWEEIITGPGSKYVYVYNFTEPERDCPACHESCEAGCWGEGPDNCQKFSKINCSPQCHQGRCFGPKPRECCHLFCAGGCTGPKQSDCLVCDNDDDEYRKSLNPFHKGKKENLVRLALAPSRAIESESGSGSGGSVTDIIKCAAFLMRAAFFLLSSQCAWKQKKNVVVTLSRPEWPAACMVEKDNDGANQIERERERESAHKS